MKFWDLYIKLIIIECVAVFTVITAVFVTKYCFKATFLQSKAFYNQSILTDTDVNEVLKGEI